MNKEIEIAGKKIFYRVYGKGKPVCWFMDLEKQADVWKNQVDF